MGETATPCGQGEAPKDEPHGQSEGGHFDRPRQVEGAQVTQPEKMPLGRAGPSHIPSPLQ